MVDRGKEGLEVEDEEKAGREREAMIGRLQEVLREQKVLQGKYVYCLHQRGYLRTDTQLACRQ